MLLTDARRPARTGPHGELVRLQDQDRARWDAAKVEEGRRLVRALIRRGQPGPYQIQAAINAVHTDPPTDWQQVAALYDQLLSFTDTPVIRLNRAVAIAETEGPRAALELTEALPLEHYHLFHAVRADLLRRLGRDREADAAYAKAIARSENAAERAFLQRRRQQPM
jgi:RNA polymerase sigma-70 factor (ECF subfamily)